MSEAQVALAALIASVVLISVIRSSRRRRQELEQRVREQLKQLRASRKPPTVGEALARIVTDLSTAARLLEEVSVIGLWSKSDDSSDNRRKRQGLRETDWAVSGALRALTDLRSENVDVPAELHELEQELRTLVAQVEPLPEMVTDTMLVNFALDSAMIVAARKVSELLPRVEQLRQDLAGSPKEPPKAAQDL